MINLDEVVSRCPACGFCGSEATGYDIKGSNVSFEVVCRGCRLLYYVSANENALAIASLFKQSGLMGDATGWHCVAG